MAETLDLSDVALSVDVEVVERLARITTSRALTSAVEEGISRHGVGFTVYALLLASDDDFTPDALDGAYRSCYVGSFTDWNDASRFLTSLMGTVTGNTAAPLLEQVLSLLHFVTVGDDTFVFTRPLGLGPPDLRGASAS